MINGYDIKLINNEKVLYIYLDFNSEFAKLDNKNTKSLKKNIEKYLINNNIDFKSGLVAIFVGGLMIGTITLNKPNIDNVDTTNNSNKIVAIINESNLENKVINETNVDKVQSETKIVNDKVDKESINEKNVKKSEVVNKPVKTNKVSLNSVENNDVTKEDIPVTNNVVVEEKTNNNLATKEKIDNNKYVTIYRKSGSVLKLELEDYIVGVVGAEMPASFNKEALKAQAVLARTYAMKSINNNKRLTDDNSTQNYKSNDELKQTWGSSFNTYYNKIKSAVTETRGLILTYNGNIIDAVYHSTSNGYTEDAQYVWSNSVPYLKSVKSDYDSLNKNFISKTFYTYDEVSTKLNNIVDVNTDFNILNRNESGRVVDIDINGVTYSGVNFRTLLKLRSTDFEIEKTDLGINITTKGYGHGVGLSQYGANGMANNGFDFKSILLHYYNGVNLKNIY